MIEEIVGPQIGAPAILEQASAKRYGKFYASARVRILAVSIAPFGLISVEIVFCDTIICFA